MKKYKVAYISGTRADFGIVRRYLSYLSDDEAIDFSVLVTGAHLEKTYGYTVDDIRADGFFVEEEFPIGINTENTACVIESMSRALRLFGEYFQEHKYDLLIVLGDRYEIMAASIAAAMQKIPLLHLHGGEQTLGNYDEFIRHSITKMSNFHFTSTEDYRRRVIQLGERPDRVFYMGALGAENCHKINLAQVDERVLKLPCKKYFTVVYHPETLTDGNVELQAINLLSALDSFSSEYGFVFIGSNADTGASRISMLFQRAARECDNFLYFESLTSDSYLHLVKNSIALIGNSSSGIIEAPSLNTYTVNIGKRQDGRIRSGGVIDIDCSKESIERAIREVLDKVKAGICFDNPYFKPDCAENYYKKTKEILSIKDNSPKVFYDL